jgi:hypothetical protein
MEILTRAHGVCALEPGRAEASALARAPRRWRVVAALPGIPLIGLDSEFALSVGKPRNCGRRTSCHC